MDTNNTAPISDLLRRTIGQAVEQGQTNYLSLERETGVQRASIRRFVTGERTLRLDMADKLAVCLGLELQPSRRKRRRPPSSDKTAP